MNSSSRDILLKLFDEIIEWKRKKKRRKTDSVKFNWTFLHLSVVRDYVSKLVLNSDLSLLSSAKSFNDEKDPKIVALFAQELQEFFVVPKLHQLFHRDDTLKKNELVAAFINFLLQLLCRKTGSVNSIADRIDDLEKELRFLVTILGDTILLCDEHEEVQNLLAEFEVVANEAGILAHSVVFSTYADRVFKTIDDRLGVFLKHVDLLKANIINFLNLLPLLIAKSKVTPRAVAVDSLFIINSLVYDLENLLNQDDSSMIGDVKDQIKRLHKELLVSQSLLKDIKIPAYSEMVELNEHVTRSRDAAYEAEYLINSFLVGDAPLWYVSIRLTNIIHKFNLIGTGLQEIKNNSDIGALKVAKNFSSQLPMRAKRSFEIDDIVVGFEDKTIELLDLLVGRTGQLQIISIFGMPGLGKTTFARKLYNHPSVNYRFDKRLWCVVSQTYQRRSVLTGILISSTKDLDEDTILNMEEQYLLELVYKSLKGRRYLVVMDDMWDLNVWDDVRRCFPDDGNGSRIMFTTRNKDVAPPNSIICELPYLSNSQCWDLLKKKVFHNEPCPPELQGIGKEIAANCFGLPLAIVVVAGILSAMDKEESTWKNVGKNIASYISCGGNGSMMQILELSYKHLSQHLKPCFLYFGTLQEDEEIQARKLMRLWIAEGFIPKEEKSAESVAEEYLLELIDKSLIMVAKRRSNGGVKACGIHDLLRDLCLKIAGEENFLKLVDDDYSIYERGHHLLLLGRRPTPFGQHFRSFHGDLLDPPLYVVNMKLLRVLNFKIMEEDPGRLIGVEYLIHLRYLVINDLSASISSLVNLEYLHVNNNSLATTIPFLILKMVKLRYLHFRNDASFEDDCNNAINNLESLSNVVICSTKDEAMLKCSPHLRKLKLSFQPLYVEEEEAYRYPDLCFLTELESLKMTISFGLQMPEIDFPTNIKKLTLDGLQLSCEQMSIIGRLSNLEVLKLAWISFEGNTWETKDGEFEQLRFLKMKGSSLAQWNVASNEHFPRLQRLLLHDCYNMKEIPREIGEIATLQSIEVQYCPKTVADSAREIEQEQRDMGNEELTVIIIWDAYTSMISGSHGWYGYNYDMFP